MRAVSVVVVAGSADPVVIAEFAELSFELVADLFILSGGTYQLGALASSSPPGCPTLLLRMPFLLAVRADHDATIAIPRATNISAKSGLGCTL